jgi:hypothetical protein
MSILSHHITRREAPAVRAALVRDGYVITSSECYAYVANLINSLEPMARGRHGRLTNLIEAAILDLDGEHHGQVDLFFADEAIIERQEREALAHADRERIEPSAYIGQ